jgi:hypothetical protein
MTSPPAADADANDEVRSSHRGRHIASTTISAIAAGSACTYQMRLFAVAPP